MITLLYTYYNNPCMLKRHLKKWNALSRHILNNLKIVIVDDHSEHKAIYCIDLDDKPHIDLSIYWVEDNIPWNQGGAKNLGFKVAETDWIFSLDADHVISEKSFEEIFKISLNRECFYTFKRIEAETHKLLNTPQNIFLIHKDVFWLTGGYDEDFCGHYGYEDKLFRDILEQKARHVHVDDITVECYLPEQIEDCATLDFSRDTDRNKLLYQQKSIQLKKPENTVRFKWKKVL